MNEFPTPSDRPKLTKAEKKAKFRNDYPEPIKSRREELKAIMIKNNIDREQHARSCNYQGFEKDYRSKSRVNIYGRAVEMMMAMPDKGKQSGQHLAEWYLRDFNNWLNEEPGRKERLSEEFLNPPIQIQALQACTIGQKALLCEVFNITHEKLIEDVTELLDAAVRKQDFVNAADMARKYNLVQKYRFDEIALPLLLKGNDQDAYRLLEGHVDLQRELVKFLDDMSGASLTTVEEILRPYIDKKILTLTRVDRFAGKTLDKLLQTIIFKNISDYHFDDKLSTYAPKHSTHGCLKQLKFQINERYTDTISDENYFQNMTNVFKSVPTVREPILHFLWDSNQYEKQIDAISLAMHLGFDHSNSPHLPGKMKDFFRSPDPKLNDAKSLLGRRLMMPVPRKDEKMYAIEEEERYLIFTIENESALKNLCSELQNVNKEANPVYVGFDSEWKPSNLTLNNTSKIALIQLFFNEKVYLVDCVELEKENISNDWWQQFAHDLFLNDKLKIIGFDMRNDLDAMITIPALKGFLKLENINNCFDLKRLAENICDIDMEILELTKKTFKLADLTRHFLNRELDKTEQCSNWQCRPLRKKQIIYAALDAVVVVQTFMKIIEVTQEKNVITEVQSVVQNSNVMAPKKEKNQRLIRKLKTISWQELYETLRSHRDTSKPLKRPHEVRVIVDTMLLGFGKSLRRCGIDVYLPRDVSDFRAKLKLISRLGGDFQRHILTVPSKSYNALKQDYERYVIALPDLNSKSTIEQLTAFFDLFNFDLQPEDEYPRCIECNSRLQIKFPGPVLHFLHQYCVIHLQNVYRADMSEFPLEEWWDRMNNINPADYDGIEVKMSRPRPKSKWIVATVPTGCLHITRQTAIHNNLADGVEVRIHKVPDDEFQRPNLCFYICGDCGTVAYDGRPPSASYSSESVL